MQTRTARTSKVNQVIVSAGNDKIYVGGDLVGLVDSGMGRETGIKFKAAWKNEPVIVKYAATKKTEIIHLSDVKVVKALDYEHTSKPSLKRKPRLERKPK